MDKLYYRDHEVNKEHLHSNVYKEVPLQRVSFINRKI